MKKLTEDFITNYHPDMEGLVTFVKLIPKIQEEQAEVTIDSIIEKFSYPEDKELMRDLINDFYSLDLYTLGDKYNAALEALKINKYPEKNGVKYYKDILDGLELSKNTLVKIDEFLAHNGQRNYIIYADELRDLKYTDGTIVMSEIQADLLISQLIISKKIKPVYDIVCPNCSEDIYSHGFDLEQPAPSSEELLLELDGDLFCEDCECHILDMKSVDFVENMLQEKIEDAFENHDFKLNKFEMKNKPNMEIDLL